jgi:hypothetical protein
MCFEEATPAGGEAAAADCEAAAAAAKLGATNVMAPSNAVRVAPRRAVSGAALHAAS